jgi:hypothetical protein
MNFLEGLLHSATKQDPPLHVGEVMGLWAYYTAAMESRSLCMLMANHTPDQELRETMEHFIADVEEPQAAEIERFLRDQGVPLSLTSPDKPKAEAKAVPEGAKFTDSEVANMLAVKMEGLLNLANAGLAVALRDDVSGMFLRYHSQIVAQGFTLKKLMRNRGWLKVPPAYYVATVPAGR